MGQSSLELSWRCLCRGPFSAISGLVWRTLCSSAHLISMLALVGSSKLLPLTRGNSVTPLTPFCQSPVWSSAKTVTGSQIWKPQSYCWPSLLLLIPHATFCSPDEAQNYIYTDVQPWKAPDNSPRTQNNHWGRWVTKQHLPPYFASHDLVCKHNESPVF